jgi:hypothetical protein
MSFCIRRSSALLTLLSGSLIAIAQPASQPSQGDAAVTGKIVTIELTEADCRRLFEARAAGAPRQSAEEVQLDALSRLQCALLDVNASPARDSDLRAIGRFGKDSKAHVEIVAIARAAAQQEGDVKRTCEVIARGIAGMSAVAANPAAAAYAGTFGVAQCKPLATEVAKKNPLLLTLPPSYVGPYLLTKTSIKDIRKNGSDFAKKMAAKLPKDDAERALLLANPAAGVAVQAAKDVKERLKKAGIKL